MSINSSRKIPTYTKYFLSYFLIITVLVLGFFFIIRKQMIKNYFNQQVSNIQTRIDDLASQLNAELAFLTQINSSLESDTVLLEQRMSGKNIAAYVIKKELLKYDTSSLIISNITWLSREDGTIVSTHEIVSLDDGKFKIKQEGKNDIIFDPQSCLESSRPQLFFFEQTPAYAVYFPKTSKYANTICFFSLDISEIEKRMRNLISLEVVDISLINNEKEVLKVSNTENISSFQTNTENSGNMVCVSSPIYDELYLTAQLSSEFLNHWMIEGIKETYFMLIMLGALGILMIFMVMRVTYVPLKKLTAKIMSENPVGSFHLDDLESAFLNMKDQNLKVKNELENYRGAIHKALLNSFVSSRQREQTELPDIDKFFEADADWKISLIYISVSNEEDLNDMHGEWISDMLPCAELCVMLEKTSDSVIFLIGCPETAYNAADEILALQHRLWQERGWRSVVSRETDSPLNIPALCESLANAEIYCSKTPVVNLDRQMGSEILQDYPHEQLDELSAALMESDFEAIKKSVDALFRIIYDSDKESSTQSFLMPCMLIDMLMLIINSMSQTNITFAIYENIFYETLYLCRSYYSSDSVKTITSNINKLLDIYENECMEKMLDIAAIRHVMEECYCQPDFSISILACRFHVSIGYMSYQFKTKLNMNFSDYLWLLRLHKAKELLLKTDMSVEKIAMEVGYYSLSGFRRKFKKEMGMTPMEFRAEGKTTMISPKSN